MEENVSNISKEEAAAKIYKYAASLLIDQKRSPSDAKRKLMEKGLDEQNATIIIDSLHKEISTQKKPGQIKICSSELCGASAVL